MKPNKFLSAISIAASALLLFSACNSSGSEKVIPSDTTTSKAASKVPEKVSNVFIIQHKVANYAKWKMEYNADDSVRNSYGLHNYVIGRGMDDSNTVVIILKMEDVNKAKEFGGSKDLKAKMQKAGVMGTPGISFLNVVMDDNSKIDQTARVMITHKVKDWDVWKKEFDSHKDARMSAGLLDRGLSYNEDNNHIVSIVFAITDMKKAKDFIASKDLKDKMAAAGVEGPPTIFFYNIVK